MKKLIYLSLIALMVFPSLGLAQTKPQVVGVIPGIAPWPIPPGPVPPWPVYGVKVISPNGGEVWNRNEVHTISWSFPIIPLGEEIGAKETWIEWGNFYWPKASIDLYRRVEVRPTCISGDICPEPVERSVFVKHIATVNPFDMAYSWKISNDISDSRNYVIRITVKGGGDLVRTTSPKETNGNSIEKPLIYSIWDESDGKFTIIGEQPPPPDNIQEVIKLLKAMMEQLRRAIALLESML